ncbi:glycosyltransferase family 2 protein [Shewanella sp. SNU WT4]|uniref:glycosyltransferase family 2 protein n=1 Tax=Shewanella sp. SNU WT4 TaxID=2590015 RepID=UPI001129524D|nr:glycosyltransferase family 2 protein [Shewanella sp. SNU WT4]QDF67640.1 glycosyltransferase family 2 protein [Shewanella sp. SNU WT4]
MKLSILTPSYQCDSYVKRSYLNLLSQTHDDWEWIFVDDGSTDNTANIIREISSFDSRVRFFTYTDNMGRGFARNFGIENASTNYIVVWDVDDLYHETRLDKIANAFKSGYDFFCSYALISDMRFKLKGARHFSIGINKLDAEFVHATLAFNKSISDDLNYPVSMRTGEDLNIMLFLQTKYKGFYCKEYLFIYFEDREVNIFKTIDAVKSRLSVIKTQTKLFKSIRNGVIRKEVIKVSLKLVVLKIMSIFPSLYLYSVKFRQNEFIDSNLIDDGHLRLFCNYKGDN